MKLKFKSQVIAKSLDKKEDLFSSASLSELKKYIPEINEDKNPDLLPVSFNAFVANKGNKNMDILDSKGTMEVVDSFVYKPINIEHDGEKTIGVITGYAFSEYGTNKELTKEEASKMDTPYNVTLSGLIWKNVNERMAEVIEESSDSESEDYGLVSASWELSFEDYDVVGMDEGKDEMVGSTIFSGTEKETWKASMIHRGGKGKKDGKTLYRLPSEGLVGLGIGFVENPAADVSGICTKKTKEPEQKTSDNKEIISKFEEIDQKINKIQESFANIEKNGVFKKEKVMIKRIKDINADSIKASLGDDKIDTTVASALSDIIKTAWNNESEEFETKLQTEQLAKQKLEADTQELKEQLEASTSKISTIEAELISLKEKEATREREEKFQSRMEFFDSKYDVSEKHRPLIAKKLNSIETDADFEDVKNELDVFLPLKKEDSSSKASDQSKQDESDESDDSSVDDSVSQASKQTGTPVPNTNSKSDSDDFADAFQIGKNVTLK